MVDSALQREQRAIRKRSLLNIAVLACLCLAGGYLAEQLSYRSTLLDARAAAAEELGKLRAGVESTLNADAQLIRGLIAYVRARPDLDQQAFASIARDLIPSSRGGIRNLALAKDLVITHMYPIEGNEKAIGLRFREVKSQWPAVEKAIRENVIVIAGPLDLVQGGVGIIARFPVYLNPTSPENRKLWGMVSTVIDFKAFLARINIDRYLEKYRIALMGRDGKGADGGVFWGDASVLNANPILLDVNLVTGKWVIAAQPVAGWPKFSEFLAWAVIAAATVFMLGSAIILINSRFELETARTTRLLHIARLEAESAKEAAERANRAKSEFLAGMSHDLRTPLNAILGFAQMLKFHPSDMLSLPQREIVDGIDSGGRHLLELVDQILELARIEAGELPLALENVNANEVVAECIALTTPLAEPKGITFRDRFSGGRPSFLRADRLRFKQALLNLFSNAVKYNLDQGTITVDGGREDDGLLRISVMDTGRGIAESDRANVFQMFQRLGADPTTTRDGLGIGLAVTKLLVEQMEGRVGFESELGVGSTFWIELPLAGDGLVTGAL